MRVRTEAEAIVPCLSIARRAVVSGAVGVTLSSKLRGACSIFVKLF